MKGVVAAGHPLTALAGADVLRDGGNAVDDAVQRFNVGPSSCGAYGTTLGLAEALGRFGSARLADLTAAPARAAREGVEVVPMQAFLFQVLEPILRSTPEAAAIYAPGGGLLAAGGP